MHSDGGIAERRDINRIFPRTCTLMVLSLALYALMDSARAPEDGIDAEGADLGHAGAVRRIAQGQQHRAAEHLHMCTADVASGRLEGICSVRRAPGRCKSDPEGGANR